MILLVSVRWMILASLSYVAVAIDWRFHSVFDDRNWNEPIHVVGIKFAPYEVLL